VGGRSSEDEWVTDLFFFDLKKIELQARPKLPKALFGPSMTKPSRTANNEVIFFVAGGTLDTKKQTEIYQYLESQDGIGTWS
jgi:hypothetical protein